MTTRHCYPRLELLLVEIALDNELHYRADAVDWDALEQNNYVPLKDLELMAAGMTHSDLVTLAAGEQSDAERIAADNDAEPLHHWLSDVFDGRLHCYAYPRND